ncbi:hypothetical protein MRB53_032752 [Persea americana]|uniref:Uncharacterized protein n=1 Tax=Persea americana TaxID=3435 RepID=A0ACC2KST2_PERAE|nr:hypothetical protein MRB53_032752 [Persea americana]
MGKKVRNFFSPLNPLSFHFKIAHKIQELRERLDALAKENKDFHLNGGVDDVWNEDPSKWRMLRTGLKCGVIGSKILVTSRSETVARRMEALLIPLPILSAVESWTLFEEVAHPPTRFVSIGKDIVKKCGGIPLAIKTLGGMLLNEPSEMEWQSVRDSELWKTQDHDGGILPSLRLSYDHLTSSLKQCFAYCAVIPKGCPFLKDILIKRWIAQGFIHSDDENELLEEEGEKYFNALLRRSLFQVDEETVRNDLYKMHDLIHDLLRSVAGKECVVVEGSMMNDLTRHLALCDGDWEPKNLDALKKWLENIRNGECARRADLKAKKRLHPLHLEWTDKAEGNAQEVINNLEPPSNLKKLLVSNYRALEFLEMNRVGCERIDFPMSKSLKKFVLRDMPNLERWSFPEVDDDEDGQVILRFFHTLKIFNCPKLIRLLKLLLPALEFLKMNGVGCDRIDLPMSKSLKEVKLEHMPNLESWSSREVDGDEDDQVILRFFCTLDIFDCP